MNSLKKLPLAGQLYAIVITMVLVMAAIVSYTVLKISQDSKVLSYTIDNRLQPVLNFIQLTDDVRNVRDSVAQVSSRSKTPAEAADVITERLADIKQVWNAYMATEMSGEEADVARETHERIEKFFPVAEAVRQAFVKGDLAAAEAQGDKELKPAFNAIRKEMDHLGQIQLINAKADREQGQRDYKRTLAVVGMAILAGLVLSLGTAIFIIRNTMRTLGADPQLASGIASRIADGELMFEIAARQGSEQSLMGRLRKMKDSLLHSKLDYEGQLTAIGRVQAVIEFKPDGTIVNANENFLKVMGYSLGEIVGKHHSLFVDAVQRDSAEYRGFWDALRHGQAQTGQFRRVAKSGKDVWIQGVYNPIADVNGKPFKVVKYGTDITEQRNAAALNAAFKGALDKVGANVIVANNEFDVIYVNESGNRLIGGIQGDLRKDLPGLDASRLVGASVDVLSKNPAQQRQFYAHLNGTHSEESVIGGRTVKITANPMKDDTGRRLGTVLEWVDRTAEVQTEAEVQNMVQAVTDGKLDDRISLAGKSGFFVNLSTGLNGLVDTISSVVNEVQALVDAANAGNLTQRISVQGAPGLQVKLGAGINDLTRNMEAVISQVKEAASEVNRGADEISQGNTNLSQRTEEQASSLEETASSMEEMTSTVKQNADNAGQANQLAIAARDQAEKGGAVVAKAVRAMTEINDSSKKIADIIGVIDEIAFQTNLLALNAAVEAARAGEQGRGFAVVATEVRNLAGRSATAAKEIKALIQDSVKKVDEGSGLVTQSGATLEQIVSAVKKVTDIVAEIAAASQEQSAGIEQVNKAVMQLDELTQQNAALVEEASAASQSMASQARGLNETMAGYTVSGSAQGKAGVKVAAMLSSASSVAPADRRKSPNRPWAGKASAPRAAARPTAPAPARPATATAGGEEVWKEF